MYEGEFIDTVDPDAVTDEDLGLLMAGRRPDEDTAVGEGGPAVADAGETGPTTAPDSEVER